MSHCQLSSSVEGSVNSNRSSLGTSETGLMTIRGDLGRRNYSLPLRLTRSSLKPLIWAIIFHALSHSVISTLGSLGIPVRGMMLDMTQFHIISMDVTACKRCGRIVQVKDSTSCGARM